MSFQRKNSCIVFFGERISSKRQNLFSSISILSVLHYENIADKLKIINLYFIMIFLFKQIRYQEFYKNINLTTLGGCRIFLQQPKVSSVHPTCSSINIFNIFNTINLLYKFINIFLNKKEKNKYKKSQKILPF